MKILISAASKIHNNKNKSFSYKLLEKTVRSGSLALAQLAAVTPKKHEIEIIDENRYELIDINKKYDLVGISFITQNAIRAYKIADEFRRKGIPVVLGGYHPSSLPEEAKQHADSVVIGEAELNWPKLLNDFENDQLKPFYRQEKPVDPRLIPLIRREIGLNFLHTNEVQATRGCPYRCDFCCMQNVEGYTFRKRPIENVIEEIKGIKSKSVFFDDSSLTIDVEFTKELFGEMKSLNKYFQCHGNINTLAEDDELLKLSKEAGCLTWYIGFESISQESLNSVHKNTNKVEKYESAVKKIRKYGLSIRGMFVFGFDYDKKNIFNETLKKVKNWRLDVAYFMILTPFPGTPLYNRLDEEGRILTKDWSQYTESNVLFEPKNMTKEELYEGVRSMVENYYSFSNVARRTLDNHKLNLPRFVCKASYNLSNDRHYIKRDYDL